MKLRCVVPLAACISFLASMAAAADAPAPPPPEGRLPLTVVPTRYALELRIDPARPSYQGEARIAVAIAEPTETIWLHGGALEITTAGAHFPDGHWIPLTARAVGASGLLELASDVVLPAGPAELRLGFGAKIGSQLIGTYAVTVGGERYVLTQMEPLAARQSFPCFDEPAFKTPWDLTLVVPGESVAVANTRQVAEERQGDGWRKVRFATTEPLPTYLIAYAVGPWEIFAAEPLPPTPQRATPLPLRGVAVKGRASEMRWILDQTARVLPALEAYFGLGYPFDKLDLLAAPEFGYGAMENPGLIGYQDSLLFVDAASPTSLRQGSLSTHAHELAHMWFGDLVTMPWWDDIWLNEGFATWLAAKIVGQLEPAFETDQKQLGWVLEAMGQDSLASTRRVAEPITDWREVMSAFDGVTYAKGGAVLAMFESYLGAERFRQAMGAHVRQFARGSATSADLMRSLARGSEDPDLLVAAFRSFLDQPGVPLVETDLVCADGKARVRVTQRRFLPLGSKASAAQTWKIPFCMRYGAAEGGLGAAAKHCVVLDEAEEDLALPTAGCPDWLLPNADGAGYYRFALAANDRAAADAAFSRWSPLEQRVYADSLVAAFWAGAVSPAAFLAALPSVAAAPSWHVAEAPVVTLRWMHEHLATTAADRAALEALVRRVYGPRLQALGLDERADEPDRTRLERRGLLELLAWARDAALRRELGARAARVFGDEASPRFEPDAVGADERAVAFWVYAQDGGAAAHAALERALGTTEDTELRGELLAALGAITDPKLAAQARALVLTPAVRTGEMWDLVGSHFWWPENRAAARAWFEASADALFEKWAAQWRAYLPEVYASGFCSEEEARLVEARYGERVQTIEGGPRAMAQNLESIRLCAAQRAHHRALGFEQALPPADAL